jgi:putative flavoprotein involved in K+ transport
MRTLRRNMTGPLVEEGSAFMDFAAKPTEASEPLDVLVIGAGQAGLSVGHYLKKRGVKFLILDANERIGDQWRRRWDSLRLFTPARFDGLAGMPFPAPRFSFPTKDEMADYLEAYARRFELPVACGVRVDRLSREGGRYVATAGDRRFEARQVVVAMASYQKPRVPEFAAQLDAGIVQLHSSEYRNPRQLREGSVLVVGAGNSGSEIALELARHGRPTWMSGRDTGHVPFRIDGIPGRLALVQFVLRFLFHRVLTLGTPIGRRVRPKIVSQGGPLIRVKPKDLAAAGVRRVPRVAGVRDGKPFLADGQVLDPANVVWSTGFHPGFSWIDLPTALDEHGEPPHARGIVESQPGLYFVGLHYLYALSSTMVHGVARDAAWVAAAVARRAEQTRDGEDAEHDRPGRLAAAR